MAEGGKDFISSIQRELECGICLDEITNAKLLQCLHTFCEKCLETLNKHGEISCPLCRTTTTLSEQGVSGLASNRFVNRITELVQAQRGSSTSSVSFCGNCDDERVIKFYCFDCEHFLCETCTDAHNKVKLLTQGHQVVQLNKFSSKDCENFVGNQAKCKRHNKEELRFYCEDCDECICRDCTVVEHRNHNCLHIEDAAAKQTEVIQNKMTRVEDCFDLLDTRCKLLDESSSVLKKEAEKAKSDMKATCDLLIQNIKKHLEEETNDIEKQTQDHLQVLSSQKETLLAQKSKLRDSLSFNKAVLNRGCLSEIMELKHVLNDRITELECSIQRQIEPSIKLLHVQYETNNNDNMDVMISRIGKVRFHFADHSESEAEDTEIKSGTEERENRSARSGSALSLPMSKSKKNGMTVAENVLLKQHPYGIKEVNIKLEGDVNQGFEESGPALAQFQEFGDYQESYETTEHFMKMFLTTYRKQLEKIKKKYNVEVHEYSDKDGKRKVKIKAWKEIEKSVLSQAREEFITLYQKAKDNSLFIRFRARETRKRDKLREVVQTVVRELPVVLDKADDRISFQIYGEKAVVQEALEEIGRVVEIETDQDSKIYGAKLSRGQSSTHFKAEEAMEVDNNDLGIHETQFGAVKISVLKGDITDQRVDAIVNAANENLSHGGGVAGAIVMKGGYSIQEESDQHVRRYGHVKVGHVAVTMPGWLRCKYIIHAVGPRWTVEGEEKSKKLLRMACINSLMAAENLELTSIAFPAISSGIFGMPKDISAEIMFAAVEEYADSKNHSKLVVNDIRFVIIDEPTVRVFKDEFEFRYLNFNYTPQKEVVGKTAKLKVKTTDKRERPSLTRYTPQTSKSRQELDRQNGSKQGFQSRKGISDDSYKQLYTYSAAIQRSKQFNASGKDQTRERKTRDGEKQPSE